MITQSGCFGGSSTSYNPIDTAAEAAAVVDELQNQQPSGDIGEQNMLAVQQLANVAGEYARRIRLLTWAVVAIVVYLVLKEANR
jgi:hypothetical protein